MTIYWLLYAILVFFSFFDIFCKYNTQTKKIIVGTTLFLFVILSTIYDGESGDLQRYKALFTEFSFSSLSQRQIFEPIYILISSCVKVLNGSYLVLRFVLACIVMKLWYEILLENKKVVYKDYSVVILLILWALKEGHIFVIRSTIAVAIAVYSIKFIQQHDLKKFIISVLIMLGFHSMSVVWFPAYFIYDKNEYRKYYITLSLLFAVFHSRIGIIVTSITSKVSGFYALKVTSYIYKGLDGSTGGTEYDYATLVLKGSANMLLLMALFIYVSKRKIKLAHNDEFDHYFNLYSFGAMLYVFSMSTAIALSRMSLPYTTLQFIMLPYIFDLPEVSSKLGNKLIFYTLFILYLTVRMSVQMTEGIRFVTIFGG